MGLCVNRPSKHPCQGNSEALPVQLTEGETKVLSLIYEDLSQRTVERKINLENFLLFFHKNGFWGQRLFEQFVQGKESKQLSEGQFIRGMAKIFKCSQKEKIQLLYKFFSKKDNSNNSGVYFHQFLTLLYNYPKQDLKEILSDKDFIDYELKKRRRRQVEVKKSETLALSHQELILKKNKFSWEEKNVEFEVSTHKEEEKMDEQSMASMVGEQIIHNVHECQPHETLIDLKNGDRVCDIKTINIQQVVKKFALKVFKDAQVDHKAGKLTFEQFYNWISGHKALFENYYEGFHFEVWEANPMTKDPKFLASPAEKESRARLLVDDQIIEVQLRLFHSILMVCKSSQSEPFKVICLDGLAVTRICDMTYGLGIAINHKFQIYKEKSIFFKNEAILLEWMELMKFYKGESIHDKYIVGEKIGTGKFSVVYKCKHSFEQREYAMKEIATFKLDSEALDLIAHESSIMQVIEHPLLLRFKECVQTKKHIYIITELVNGVNLFEEVKEFEYLQEYDAAKIAQMIIVGVSYLHSLEIVHRDLKPENIMVVKTAQLEIDLIKIIDMGFSNYLSQLNSKSSEEMLSGTPNYMAPEILREEKFDFKIDNFAIGVIIYFMLTGALPFNGYNIPEILQNTIEGFYTYPESQSISTNAKNLIDGFLKNKPEERISLDEALKHPWFDILKKSRSVPRKKRPSIFTYHTNL